MPNHHSIAAITARRASHRRGAHPWGHRKSPNHRFFLRIAVHFCLFLAGCQPGTPRIAPRVPAPNLDQIDLINKTYGQLVRETWSVHRVQGYKLGHRWTRVFRQSSRDQAFLQTIVIDDLLITRFNATNHQILRSATRCFENGALFQMEYEVESRGQRRRLAGQVVNQRLHLQQIRGDRKTLSDVPWSASDGGFFALERSLAQHPLSPGQVRDVTAWLPLIDRLQTYRLTAMDWEQLPINDVSTRLLRIDVTAGGGSPIADRRTEEPTSRSNETPSSLVFWTDVEGQVVRRWRRVLGQTTELASQGAAMAPNESLKFDVALDVRVPLTPAWPDAAVTRDAVFRVELTEGNPAALLPQCAYQRVTPIDDATATVRVVTAWPPPTDFSAGEAPPTASDVEPNGWLESNHPRILEFARAEDDTPKSKQQIALELRDRVAGTLEPEAFGNSLTSAAGALRRQAGDCTEHAMLLAAACRARQVPARVAVGLLYVPENEVFEYHMWTEFWTGSSWRPLDATLKTPSLAADRLKISDTDLSEESDYGIIAPVLRVMGRMKIHRISPEGTF